MYGTHFLIDSAHIEKDTADDNVDASVNGRLTLANSQLVVVRTECINVTEESSEGSSFVLSRWVHL